MQGEKGQAGIIPRSFTHLFSSLKRIHKANPKETLMVRISYAEVYNEKLLDLLGDKPAANGGGGDVAVLRAERRRGERPIREHSIGRGAEALPVRGRGQ